MAQGFNKTIKRQVTFKGALESQPEKTLVFEVGPHGIAVDRGLGSKTRLRLTWRDITALLIMHGRG